MDIYVHMQHHHTQAYVDLDEATLVGLDTGSTQVELVSVRSATDGHEDTVHIQLS